MRNLFLCKTPVQVLRAIQMTYYEKEFLDSDICLFDTFGSAEGICLKLNEIKLFKHAFFVKNNDFKKSKLLYLSAIYAKNEFNSIIRTNLYDNIITFNINSCDAVAAYNILRRKKKVHMLYIEDCPAIYSYAHLLPSLKYILVYRLLGVKLPTDYTEKWFFSVPEKMKKTNNKPSVKLKPIDKSDTVFRDIVNKVFSYFTDQEFINADILIMEESFYTDGLMKNNADYDMFLKIKEKYSDKNIVVKLHPRTKDNRFEKVFECYRDTGVPWEVVLLNEKLQDKIIVSLSCGTMVSPKLLFSEEHKCVMLYKILGESVKKFDGSVYYDESWNDVLDEWVSLYDDKELIKVPQNEGELFSILGDWLEKQGE